MLKKTKRLLVLLIVFLMLCQTGCGSISDVGIFSQETEDNYNICISTERMRTLNPVLSKDPEYITISKLIYSSLFTLDEALVPVPDLAESYEYDENNRSVTLKLRDDVLWHDGEAFDGDDVKFTVELIKKLAPYNQTAYAGYVSNIRSVSVNNDNKYEVTINFGYDDAKGLENLTFPILPSHLYTQRTSVSVIINEGDDFKPVGTGMYQVESYDSYNELVLVANDNYYDTKAKNTITFKIFPDEQDGLNLTGIGEVSLVFMDEYDRETYITNKDLLIEEYPSNVTEVVAFNMYSMKTGDKLVRQAIAHLIDNTKIIESVYYQNGSATDSIIYPGYLGMEEGQDAYPFDVVKAQTLLARAGYVDRDSDGKLEDRYNQEFTISLLVNSDDAQKCQAAEFIRSSLEAYGITVLVDYQNTEFYGYKLAEWNFDMYLATCTVNERHDLRPLLKTYQNPVGYSNEKVDKLLTDMIGNVSLEDKQQLVAELETIIIDELPYYPMINKSFGVMIIPEFKGDLSPTFYNPYANSGEWYWLKPISEEK